MYAEFEKKLRHGKSATGLEVPRQHTQQNIMIYILFLLVAGVFVWTVKVNLDKLFRHLSNANKLVARLGTNIAIILERNSSGKPTASRSTGTSFAVIADPKFVVMTSDVDQDGSIEDSIILTKKETRDPQIMSPLSSNGWIEIGLPHLSAFKKWFYRHFGYIWIGFWNMEQIKKASVIMEKTHPDNTKSFDPTDSFLIEAVNYATYADINIGAGGSGRLKIPLQLTVRLRYPHILCYKVGKDMWGQIREAVAGGIQAKLFMSAFSEVIGDPTAPDAAAQKPTHRIDKLISSPDVIDLINGIPGTIDAAGNYTPIPRRVVDPGHLFGDLLPVKTGHELLSITMNNTDVEGDAFKAIAAAVEEFYKAKVTELKNKVEAERMKNQGEALKKVMTDILTSLPQNTNDNVKAAMQAAVAYFINQQKV